MRSGTLARVRFAIPPNDPRIAVLVGALDHEDVPVAETWRRVSEAGERLGLTRPSYQHVRRLVRIERRRRQVRAEAREVLAGTFTTLAAGRVPSAVGHWSGCASSTGKGELVLQEHKAFGASRRVEALLGLDVAAEDHQGLDGFGDELRRLGGVREGVRAGADRLGAVGGADGIDLGLDDAGVAVVDRAEHGDRAAVLARVADEELAFGGACGGVLTSEALAAAWATVSRSTKPASSRATSPERFSTSTLGSSTASSFASSARATSSLSTFSAR